MTIGNLLEQIDRGEVVLPAIQRDFVWHEGKIEKLLDSVMREFPIGIVFLWETYGDIQYRLFEKDFTSNYPADTSEHEFYENTDEDRLKLVLDGQQRLQSLYIALYGTHEGKDLYLDVLSGRETDDEYKYRFEFLSEKSAEKKNGIAISEAGERVSDNYEASYFCKVKELVEMGAWDRKKLKQSVSEELGLSDEDEIRVEYNLSLLRDALFSDRNILNVTTIDEYKSRSSRDRKSESEILEAFVRINREATQLNKSDLFFSMLKLNWRDSSETIPEFVNSINSGNSFDLDLGFVFRCLLAVSGLGTKFDVDLLRNQKNVELIKKNFSKCGRSIKNIIDFVMDCRITTKRLLGSENNLIPLIYCLFHVPYQTVPDQEVDRLRKAVYLLAFTPTFTRYAKSRLQKFTEEVLKPASQNGSGKFPLEQCLLWSRDLEGIQSYGANLVQGNPHLAHHLVQNSSRQRNLESRTAPRIYPIFSPSELRDRGYEEEEIEHFANYWIPPEGKRGRGAASDLKQYFESLEDSQVESALIDTELLEYSSYKAFLQGRESRILKRLKEETNLSNEDFKFSV